MKTIKILSANKKLLQFTSICFLLCVTIGLIYPELFPELKQQIIQSIKAKVSNLNYFQLTSFIIINNISVAILSILLGIIFFPILSILINGYFIGSIVSEDISLATLMKILPHGLFEIPAILLAFSFGIKIGLSWFQREKLKTLKKNYKEALLVLINLIVPLLIVAGLIEGSLFMLIK